MSNDPDPAIVPHGHAIPPVYYNGQGRYSHIVEEPLMIDPIEFRDGWKPHGRHRVWFVVISDEANSYLIYLPAKKRRCKGKHWGWPYHWDH